MENITYSREKLYKKYLVWTNNLSADTILTENNISLPYYIYLPDNWVDSKMRILIVGEEGYGYKGCSADRNLLPIMLLKICRRLIKNVYVNVR